MNASSADDNAMAEPTSTDAMAAYLTEKLHTLQLFLLGGYGVMFLLCVALIGYMRLNRSAALRGDTAAARKIILPAFEPLLWILGAATGTYTAFFATALSVDLYTSDIPKVSTEFFYSGRQFVFVSVVVFLYQKSVSIPALRRTLFVSFLLASYTVPVVWYLVHYTHVRDLVLCVMCARALLLLLYAFLLVRPPARASRRTLREFCAFAFVYYALLFAYTGLLRRHELDAGFALAYANLSWGALCPLVIWRVLKADTEHWRGLGQRAVALQGLFRQRRSALDERVSSQGFHLLIEMHRKFIIDFAYLDVQEQIGVGASAAVFRGLLHSRTHVAVKVYTPREFDEDTVAAFSHEAALCGALHHPNVVKFYGMCVCPPTICLVSELCQASLEDVNAAIQRRRDSNPNRQQQLINVAYMVDAARAVAYLHSFSPPFVHRDIKPSNFLVDFKNSVKLTDFGESRSLPRPQGAARDLHPYMLLASGAHVNQHGRYSGNTHHLQTSSSCGPSGSTGSSLMTVRGTVDYMAPEVINGRAGVASYGESADVYALAITMWDILHPGQGKFPTLRNNHLQIFESVMEGQRPALEDDLHPVLREIIENAWHSDARVRPSAEHIVRTLEIVQEEVQALFAAQLLSEIDTESAQAVRHRWRHTPADASFTGAEAVSHMVDSGYAVSEGEAIRLGNALMDAGHIHHLKHARGFEDDLNELYYFDEDNISVCQPIHPLAAALQGNARRHRKGAEPDEEEKEASAMLRGRASLVHTAASSVDFDRSGGSGGWRQSRSLMEQHGLCACRKLGQRRHHQPSRHRSDQRSTKHKKIFTRVGTIMEEMTSTGLTRSLLTEEERPSELLDHADHADHVAISIRGPVGA